MNKIRFTLQSVSVLAFLLGGLSLAQAQATRTWVSGVGDDANPCSRTAPCKTFQGTISKTAPKGEINVLDPGGFGAVTITKSITITSVGFEAGVLVSGTNGIIINAGVTDVVTLKGLDFEGLGAGLSGIKFIAGGQLIVEDCTINGFTTHGIEVDFPNTLPAGTNAALNVRNVRISNTDVGIRLNDATTNGYVTALINNLHTVNLKTYGVQTQTNAFATVTNSTFDRTAVMGSTTSAALQAENNSNINAENVTMTLNQNAVQVGSSLATIRLSNCSLYSNTVGITNPGGGLIISFGNNRLAGNTTPGAPTSTVLQK